MSTIDELFASIDEIVKKGAPTPAPKPKPVPPPVGKSAKIPPPNTVSAPLPEGVSPDYPKSKMVTSVPVTEWEIHVRPVLEAGTTLLHFQTRPNKEFTSYYKYNFTTTTKVFGEIKAAIAAGKPCRSSFYGTATKYLICNRLTNTLVNIPDIAQLEVSAMTSAVPTSESVVHSAGQEALAPEIFEEEVSEDEPF